MLYSDFYIFLEISATTGLALLVILMAWQLLKLKISAKWSKLVWLAACIRLLLPFSFSLSSAEAPLQISIPVSPSIFSDSSFEAAMNHTVDISPQLASAPALGPIDVVIIIWLIGALAFISLRLVGYFRFRREIKLRCDPIDDAETILLFDKLCEKLQIRGSISLMTTPPGKCPAMLGFLRPALLLQPNVSSSDNYFILKHELTHYQNKDLWMKLILSIVCALHWFNPAVHLMSRAANEAMELACDDEVLRGHIEDERKCYCEAILASAGHRQNSTALTTYFYGGKNMMMTRFKSIFAKTKKRGIIAFTLMTVMIIGVTSLVACNMTLASASEPLTATTDDCYVAIMRGNGLSDDDIRLKIERETSEVEISRAAFSNMADSIPRKENGMGLSINEAAELSGFTPRGVSVKGIFYGPNDWDIKASFVRARFIGEKIITGVFGLNEAGVLIFTVSNESAETMPAVRSLFGRELVFSNNNEAIAMLAGKEISELPVKITISGYDISHSIDISFDYDIGDYVYNPESEKASKSTKLVSVHFD